MSPVTIQLKVFLQKLCLAKVLWDEPYSSELLNKWQLLLLSLRKASPLCIPLCYFAGSFCSLTSFSLMGFCDASAEAYAAVVYLRMSGSLENTLRILASKTRATPFFWTALEVLSALLLARLVRVVSQALESEMLLEDPVCFTDLKITLYWIKGQDKE